MKKKLALITFSVSVLFSSAYAKETTFNQKKGKLEAQCILVSEDFGYWNAWFQQLGSSKNFRLEHASKSKDSECPPILDEGDACKIIKDISDSVTVTLKEDEVTATPVCSNCTTTRETEGTVINGKCKKEGDSCLIEKREGIVKDGSCVDLV